MLKILSSIFYLWIINAFFSSLFTPKDHSPKIRWGIWVLFYLSHYFILSNVKQAIWNFIIGYMLIFILCILLYKDSYKRMTFFALAIYLLGMIIEICVAIPFLNAGYSISDISFIGSIISKLILLVIYYKLCFHKTIIIYLLSQPQGYTLHFFFIFFDLLVILSTYPNTHIRRL